MREYLLVFLAAAVVSYLLCVVARELAMRTGAVAQVRDRDVHAVPIPYFGGVAMLGGLGAGLLVAHHLPVPRSVAGVPRRGDGPDRRRDHLRGRRARRSDRARRAHQVRRSGRRSRIPGAQRRPAVLAEPPRRRPAHPGPGARRCSSRSCWWSARSTRSTSSTASTASPAGWSPSAPSPSSCSPTGSPTSTGTPGDHGGAAVRLSRWSLRRILAAQLLPGADLHGRLGLDAARAGPLRLCAVADRPVRDREHQPDQRLQRRQLAGRCCCRSCCRSRSWWCRSSTSCSPSSAAPGVARCSTTPTRSTCTTGCWSSGTASGSPW